MKILTAKQFYEADKATVSRQDITPVDLMERAANQAYQWLQQQLQGQPARIHIFCGSGNNGGDGLALARLLANSKEKHAINTYIINYTKKRTISFLTNLDRLAKMDIRPEMLTEETTELPQIGSGDLVIDCIFGIGLNRPVASWVKSIIGHINAAQAFIISIDAPSGLFIDTPTTDLEAVVRAHFTLTFQAPKLPFFLPETGVFVGQFEVLDIGLDIEFLMETPGQSLLVIRPMAQQMYRPRGKFAHKGTMGHALIVGGSRGKMGAVVLAAKACLRAGAGKVTTLIPDCGYTIVQTTVPEAMVETDGTSHLESFSHSITPDAVGIGIGMSTQSPEAFGKFLKSIQTPTVIDADALNLLSMHPEYLKDLPKGSILTPHPGELKRLLGSWENDFDKLEKAKNFSQKHDLVLLIKGAYSITVYHDMLYVNSSGNPGMATAGSGDVLTGLLTALLAQGYDGLVATLLGTYLHGLAGDAAVEEYSIEALTAGDLIEFMGDAFLRLTRPEN